MLTKELLKSNESLKDLTDAQIEVLQEISKNDEDQVIGQKVKAIHDQYDQDIKSIIGEEKPGGVKTYDHLKSVLTDLKKKAESGPEQLQKQVEDQKTLIADLQKQIKEGSTDQALKSQLQSAQQKLHDKETEFTTYKEQVEKEKQTMAEKLDAQKQKNDTTAILNDINQFVISKKLKYKSTIPETILKETVSNRQKSLIEGLKKDWIDDGNGGEKLVFRDEKGEIIRNKENKLEPYTAGELFFSRNADLFDTGKNQNGGSTSGGGAGGGLPSGLDITSAKTQVQADSIIRTHIIENEKISRTDPKFSERQTELRSELNVAELPIKEAVE